MTTDHHEVMVIITNENKTIYNIKYNKVTQGRLWFINNVKSYIMRFIYPNDMLRQYNSYSVSG